MPDCPETGYGYIKKDASVKNGNAFAVDRFVEKPDRETAIGYLNSGDYFWNSGMFVWKASTVMSSLEQYMPDIYERLETIKASIGTENEKKVLCEEFTAMRSESVDYGVMEKAKDIFVLPGQFGWDDVGSWLAVGRIKGADENGNTVSGNVVTVNTHNSIIEAKNRLIATVGLDGVVVVDTEDVTLIGDKIHMGDIKKILEQLRTDDSSVKYL